MKKGFLFFLVFALGISLLLQYFKDYNVDGDTVQVIAETKNVSLNDFLKFNRQQLFSKILLKDGTDLEGYVITGSGTPKKITAFDKTILEQHYILYTTQKPLETSLTDMGISLTGTTLVSVEYTKKSFWEKLFEDIGPLLLFFVVFLLFMKFLLPKGGSGFPFAMKIGKLDVKNPKKKQTKFADVAGMEEVKNELSEVVDYLKHPQKYHKVGARHPRGILLYGEPGSGKTLLARAVAGESDVPFFSVSGSEFMEMLVGMGAAKVRELFGKAKAAGKAIIFIDEIDAIGRRRGVGHTGGHQEQEQTLNQILTEMDGFDTTTNIIVMAATNRPDILDPALLRAGRFDRKVMVSRPTLEERISIFSYYLSCKSIEKTVSLESLAKRTSGLVGADIENIVNEASLKLAKENRLSLTPSDFEYALEKVLMGPEKKVKSMNEQEKKIVAYHELGHAITGYLLPQVDPVEKISIVRRGQALGVTWMTPEEDKHLYSKSKFLDQLVSLLGGRAAEEVFFGKDEITTGASNDFEKATHLVKDMITKYGMEESLGLVSLQESSDGEYFVGKPYSEMTAQLIDQKIREYLSSAYEKAVKLLSHHKDLVENLSKILLEKEYLTKEEFSTFMEESLKHQHK